MFAQSALLSATFNMNSKLQPPTQCYLFELEGTQRDFIVNCFDTGDLVAYEEFRPHAVRILRKQSVLVCVS